MNRYLLQGMAIETHAKHSGYISTQHMIILSLACSAFSRVYIENNVKGFARPIIRSDNVISDNFKQSFKITDYTDVDDVKLLWDNVVRQVMVYC